MASLSKKEIKLTCVHFIIFFQLGTFDDFAKFAHLLPYILADPFERVDLRMNELSA
jgi:hypothetical protein